MDQLQFAFNSLLFLSRAPHDQNYARLSVKDESVLSEINSQDGKHPIEIPASQLLTNLEVYAPACNPPASAAILETHNISIPALQKKPSHRKR